MFRRAATCLADVIARIVNSIKGIAPVLLAFGCENASAVATSSPPPFHRATLVRTDLADVPPLGELLHLQQAEQLKQRLDLGKSVGPAATAAKLGDFFQYALDKPVTLPRRPRSLDELIAQVAASR